MSAMRTSKEPLLPSTLSQILRRQGKSIVVCIKLNRADMVAWLFREAGLVKESDELYRQVQVLQSVGDSKVSPEELPMKQY